MKRTLEVGSEPIPGVRLLQILGRGGFAEVWEAKNNDGQRLAVKFMSSKRSLTSAKEIKIIRSIQKLEHPNLLRLDSVFSIPDYIVITMELADGSLLDMLDLFQQKYRSALPIDLLLGYMKQIADALDYLNHHQHTLDGRTVGFQHCDIKPSNILLLGEEVKLADFGLCKPIASQQQVVEKFGTLDFAPPEIHRGYITNSSDQYSFAVSYYLMRTGRFPYETAPAGFSREWANQMPAPDLSHVRTQERRVIEQAMDIEPRKRFVTCRAFVDKLERAITADETGERLSGDSKIIDPSVYRPAQAAKSGL